MGLGIKSGKRTKTSARSSEKQLKPQRLDQYWIIAAALITLTTAAAFAAALFLGTGRDTADQQVQLRELVHSLAAGLADRQEQLRQQLARIAADPHLRTAFEYADQANFDAEVERLKSGIPEAASLVLVRLEYSASGTRILDEDQLPLSYAGMDMVREVISSGRIPPLEAHQVGTPDSHLALAAPVLSNDGQTTLGVIHLSLPLDLLSVPMSTGQRRFLFQQGAGRLRTTIAPKSAQEPSSSALVATAEIPNTGIELLAWQPAPSLAESAALWPTAILATGLAVLNILLLAGMGAAQRQRLGKEIEQLNAGMAQTNLGQLPSKRSIRLSELLPLDETLKHMTRKRFSQPDAPAAAAAAAPTPPLADAPESTVTPDLDLDLQTTQSSAAQPSAPPEPPTNTPPPETARAEVAQRLGNIPARVFRPYDIRGLVGSELTDDFMNLLGQALGSESQDAGSRAVLVGRDYRPSGEQLAKALTDGLRASGCDVIDLGVVPTPALYFATHLIGQISGAMLTASHDPTQYNGLKLVLAGKSATALNVAKLKQRLIRGDFRAGEGSYRDQSVLADYFEEVEQGIAFARPLKLAIDCGFATSVLVAPQLFRDLGCEVIEVRCNLEDPRAGKEIPNPASADQLRDLADAVTQNQADLGLAFDGDGDRLGIVDSAGQFIPTDRVLMLLAADLLSRAPGSEIVYDVQCSKLLGEHIESLGGKPVMWKSGTAFLKEKREETQAPLAGSYSGHIVFADRWNGFDDAFYAAARLAEVLAIDPRPSAEVFAELPSAVGTPELLALVEPGEEIGLMSQIMEMKGRLSGVKAITVDGLRVESDKGWALVRASNNQPALSFRFEANNEATLEKLKDLFRRILQSAAPNLKLPF